MSVPSEQPGTAVSDHSTGSVTSPSLAPVRPRLDSIDALRGLVMVIMALDHARGFFAEASFSPTNLAVTTPVWFFTRWITHFCAPTFVFLAGAGAFLYGARGRSTGELSRFLWTRGLWLVVLELTIVRLGWRFSLDYHRVTLLVIWALGASMIVLAGLVHLRMRWIVAIGLATILGHNALDGLKFSESDWRFVPWAILHDGGNVRFADGFAIRPVYPLLPWIGVMAAGYGFGQLFQWPAAARRQWLVGLGLAMISAFLLLRLPNLYGDPKPWSGQPTETATLMSILNCTKYPPSLSYLCMTLGPALLLLARLDVRSTRIPGWIVIFGRVPLFYYVLHLFLLHFGANLAVLLVGRPEHSQWVRENGLFANLPPAHGFPLWGVYLAWIVAVALLYPACRWFAGVKQRSRSPWLSYL